MLVLAHWPFEQASVTPCEQTQQRWARSAKRRKERLMTLLSFGASGHGRSLSREDTAGNRMTTPKAGHANGNVLHHSAVSCALMSSRSSQCSSDVNDTRVRQLKTNIILSAERRVWYLRICVCGSRWTNDWTEHIGEWQLHRTVPFKYDGIMSGFLQRALFTILACVEERQPINDEVGDGEFCFSLNQTGICAFMIFTPLIFKCSWIISLHSRWLSTRVTSIQIRILPAQHAKTIMCSGQCCSSRLHFSLH